MPAPDHITRQQIDTVRWDSTIQNSRCPLIYGYTNYLDAMTAGQWDALVLDDYAAVMPLTWRKKAGIRYLYQPAFTQQTGIFSPDPLPPATLQAFLDQLNRHFRFAEICLNYTNPHPSFIPRTNYILPLNASYDHLAAGYKKDLVKNLKASRRTPLIYKREYDLTTALRDFHQEYASRLPSIKESDYRNFETLCRELKKKDQLLTRAVCNQSQQTLCSAVFLKDMRRFYLIHSTTLPAGRTTEANHFLLDQFIREWAGSPLILDFEGSDHPGIAHFYANFGALDQPFFYYRQNRLPWPIRWLK